MVKITTKNFTAPTFCRRHFKWVASLLGIRARKRLREFLASSEAGRYRLRLGSKTAYHLLEAARREPEAFEAFLSFMETEKGRIIGEIFDTKTCIPRLIIGSTDTVILLGTALQREKELRDQEPEHPIPFTKKLIEELHEVFIDKRYYSLDFRLLRLNEFPQPGEKPKDPSGIASVVGMRY